MRLTMLLACAAVAAVPPAAAQGEFHWAGKISAGKRIEIKGVNGDITALLAAGDEVEVTATKRAEESDPESVKIEVVPYEGGVAICAVYPTGRHARRENSCQGGDDWSTTTENVDVKVHFTVRVPANVKFHGHTINGDVDATGLGSDVQAYTINGRIRVSTKGYAEAETVNGSIVAELGQGDWPNELEFKTVNGGITLTLPADLNTEVYAQTTNGNIESDFPLTISGRFSPRRLSGTIGKGGRRLQLGTVNGPIRLQKSP